MTQQLELNLSGMTCHACAALIEDELRDTAGVHQVRVDFAQKRAEVEFEPREVQIETLLKKISALGYQAAPIQPN